MNTTLSKWKVHCEGNEKWCLRIRENHGVSKTSQKKQGWGGQGKWAGVGDAEEKERDTAQGRAWGEDMDGILRKLPVEALGHRIL